MALSDGTKPPAFFCPECGQKHRADLSPLLRRPDASFTAPCRKCGAKLRVHLEEGQPVCEVAEAPPDAAPEPEETPKPSVAPKVVVPPTAPTPTPEPPEEDDAPGRRADEKPLADGTRVGRYTVRGVLRGGTTSTVYRANDPKTRRSVALKMLRANAPETVRKRFHRQVDLQANVRHPNVMPVYDRGTLGEDRPFFTMELLHRPLTLADVLRRRNEGVAQEGSSAASLDDERGIVERVLLPLADGVYVANVENGIIHGDLRPENVLLDGRTLRPYLTDFGSAEELTGGEEGRGEWRTTAYLSPEQTYGRVNARTDVWGLGALLRAALTGRPPLEGEKADLRRKAAEGQYTELPDDLQPTLSAIARKAMARDPDARYVNARQMAADLKAWLRGGHVRAVAEFGDPAAAAQETRQALRRHLRSALWVAAGLLVGLVVGSRIQLGGGNPATPRHEGAESAVVRLDASLTRLATSGAALAPDEATRAWADLQQEAKRIGERLAQTPPSQARAVLERQLARVSARMARSRVQVSAAPGVTPRFVHAPSGETRSAGDPDTLLFPGRWRVELGGDQHFTATIPFRVRKAGEDPSAERPLAVWTFPADPAKLSPERAVVASGQIVVPRLPYAPAEHRVTVPTFLIDRRKVTNAAYAAYLAARPDPAATDHVPSVGFEKGPRGVWQPTTGKAEEPVVGLSAVDARAYCAWRSSVEGHEVRLPTEAEWILAAGGAGPTRAPLSSDGSLPASPFGVTGLFDAPREWVTGALGGRTAGDLLVKGWSSGRGAPSEGLYHVSERGPSTRDESTGFRCVLELPAE